MPERSHARGNGVRLQVKHTTDPSASSRAAVDPRVWVLSLGTFAIGTDVFVVSGILPDLARDLQVSLDAAGQIVTAYALVYAIGAPIIVPLAARLPQALLATLAMGLFVLANALCAVAPDYTILLAARVLAGVSAAVYTATAYALATRLARSGRTGAALSAVALGLTASAVLGVPFGTLLGQHLGWRATFWLVTLISALAMLLLGRRPPAVADDANPPLPGIRARFAPLTQRPVLLALLPGLLWNTANMMSYTYLGAALAEHHQSDVVVLLFLVYGLGGLAGSQLGGQLVDRFGAIRPLVACLAVAAINQVLLGISSANIVTLGGALVIWSVTGWSTFSPQQSRLIAIAPQSAPLVIALYHSTIYVGAAAGAALGGMLIAGGLRPSQLHWATTALLLASLGVLLTNVRSDEPSSGSGPSER